MEFSTDSIPDDFPYDFLFPKEVAKHFTAAPVPIQHPAQPDVFARQFNVPGHHQDALQGKKVAIVGVGGLGSWNALGLARTGVTHLQIIEHDWVDITNLPRQLYYANDLGTPKAFSLGQNLVPHALAGATIDCFALPLETFLEQYELDADLLLVGVDNDACRYAACREARRRRIPAVFTMLSLDGLRCQLFLQGPRVDDACLWCALPNMEQHGVAACANAIISGCFLASAFTVFFAHRALMGWPDAAQQFNFRDADLMGRMPEQIGFVPQRVDCPVCHEFKT